MGLGEGWIRDLFHRVAFFVLPVLLLLPAAGALGSPNARPASSGPEIPVRFAGIASLLKAHILETTSWKDSEVEIQSVGDMKGVDLPPEGVEFRLAPGTVLTARGRMLAPIEASRDGKVLGRYWIAAEVSIRARVLTASRKISFKRAITSQDIVEAAVRITDPRGVYARCPEDVLGKVAHRSFSPGDPLLRDAFSDPPLVRHGETVRVRLERNGIVLTTLARAEEDGKLGQVITVRNLEFSAVLKAKVTGRAAVRMQ